MSTPPTVWRYAGHDTAVFFGSRHAARSTSHASSSVRRSILRPLGPFVCAFHNSRTSSLSVGLVVLGVAGTPCARWAAPTGVATDHTDAANTATRVIRIPHAP